MEINKEIARVGHLFIKKENAIDHVFRKQTQLVQDLDLPMFSPNFIFLVSPVFVRLALDRLVSIYYYPYRLHANHCFINPLPNKPWFSRVKNFLPFPSSLKLSSANSFSLEESKICRLGKG